MLFIVVLSIFAASGAGILIKWLLELKESSTARISWREYAIGMACTPVLAILVTYIGWVVARSNNMTFSEYLNGWEVATTKSHTQCSRDGPCIWEYSCDPYPCPYECGGYEGTGDNRHYVSRTCWKTCWHSCPYVDREYGYSVRTTLGEYTIARGVFPENPQAHQWRPHESIPLNVINRAGVGDPLFWTAVKQRCDANSPGPVTKKHDYPNYILASEHTIMKQYSSDIDDYRKRGLLPNLPKDIRPLYWADKVRFVGLSPPNSMTWQKSVEYLNAALGSQLNGDLMLVVVKNSAVSANPERYSLALKAFWQDKEIHKNCALPKNAIVVILGTEDGSVVSWSRGFTAMPLGNEKLTTMLRDGLRGLPLDPERIIGPVKSRRDAKGVHYPPDGDSALVKLLWGLDDPSTKFSRVSMSGKDSRGGFLYLKSEIQPTTSQTWIIVICAFFVCLGVWLWAAIHYDPSEGGISFRRYYSQRHY